MKKLLLLMITLLLIFSCGTKSEDTSKNNEVSKKNNNSQNKYQVTFIELGSVNCVPCKMMQPIMREIEHEYAGRVNVVFHDVWTHEGKPYAQEYGIRVIPTQVFLDANGVEYYRHEGFFPKEELVKVLEMKL